jgi:hypothetical protein
LTTIPTHTPNRTLCRLAFELWDLEEKRKKISAISAAVDEEGWELVDFKKYKYKHREVPVESAALLYKLSSSILFPLKLVDVFLRFYSADLMESMLRGHAAVNPVWNHLSKGSQSKRASTSLPDIYRALAVKIRLYGLQQRPSEHERRLDPYLSAVREALEHFAILHPKKAQDPYRVKKLLSCFMLTFEYFDELSINWQSVVRDVGEFIAGDEKLLKFFGQAGDICIIPTKPDKVGLWFYELVGRDKRGRMFLLDTKLQRAHSAGESITMVSIVERWGKVTFDLGHPETILAFDSHYMSKAGRLWLHNNNHRMRYTASVCKTHFGDLLGMAKWKYMCKYANHANKSKGQVRKPGDWCAIFKPETGESFAYVWDPDKGVGQKYNFSNCLVKTLRRNTHDLEGRNQKGAYDIYKHCFNLCDIFNRQLHDRKWPFKRGGRNTMGEWGHQDNWAMSATLQNVFNCWCDLTDFTGVPEFKALCLRLADELFEYTLTMPV